MSRKKELAKNTAILTLGKMCTQCISFFLLPLYTAILDTSDYGTFDLLITYATLLLPLINWQFDQGLFRYLLDVRNDIEKQKRLVSTIFLTNTVQSVFFSIVMTLIVKITNYRLGIFLLFYIVIHIYTAFFLQFARGIGKNKNYAIASFISATFTVILNVITLVFLGMRLQGLLLATLISQVITLVYLCVSVRPWQYIKIKYLEMDIFKQVARYSLPLIPNNLSWWVVNVSDRTIISYVLDVSMNGIYTVANKFSNVFINFYNIFNLSWTETVSLHFQDEDRDEFLSEMITTMYKIFACACLGIVALMPYVFPIMIDKKYADAYPQIIILMYAMLLRVMVGLYSCIYVAMKDSKKIAITSAMAAIINIAINLLLIGKIGIFAASISTFAAFGIMIIIRYIDINKTIKMKINSKVFVSSLIIGTLLSISYYINNKYTNLAMLVVVVMYSVFMNIDIIKNIRKIMINKLKGK